MRTVQPGVDYTPPPSEPMIHLAPEVPQSQSPRLFGPRSPRTSPHDWHFEHISCLDVLRLLRWLGMILMIFANDLHNVWLLTCIPSVVCSIYSGILSHYYPLLDFCGVSWLSKAWTWMPKRRVQPSKTWQRRNAFTVVINGLLVMLNPDHGRNVLMNVPGGFELHKTKSWFRDLQ